MHIPVLKKEVLRYLDPKPGENFIDGTFGGGGHSLSILTKNAPDGKVLGIELDEELYKEFKNFDERLILQRGSYVDLKEIAENNSFFPDGVLLDVGMCSFHVDISKRGFSFLREEPLDMRYDTNSEKKATDIINNYSLEDLKRIFINYGEEREAEKIAKEIIKERKRHYIKTTFKLNEIIKKAKRKREKIHPSTKIFQALRIETNDELNNLKIGIKQASEIIKNKGRIVIISFHSLEDRIVKENFKELSLSGFEILTPKPITPIFEEIKNNKRARSAKLRAIFKK